VVWKGEGTAPGEGVLISIFYRVQFACDSLIKSVSVLAKLASLNCPMTLVWSQDGQEKLPIHF